MYYLFAALGSPQQTSLDFPPYWSRAAGQITEQLLVQWPLNISRQVMECWRTMFSLHSSSVWTTLARRNMKFLIQGSKMPVVGCFGYNKHDLPIIICFCAALYFPTLKIHSHCVLQKLSTIKPLLAPSFNIGAQ